MADFFDPLLLETEYFSKYARAKDRSKAIGLFNSHRNYDVLVSLFDAIAKYDVHHARSFAKRIKTQDNDWTSCEAVFAELIVYGYYLRLHSEGFVRSLALDTDECDVIVERSDRTKMYLETLCVMPYLSKPKGSTTAVRRIKTQTQTDPASLRQKLLRKMDKQGQFAKPRENYAVVELNDISIAGDFHVFSSLSDGYKVRLDRETHEIIGSGFDWSNSFLSDPRAKYLKGLIWFDLGNYEDRRILINPHFAL
jgi:hypothetical protein